MSVPEGRSIPAINTGRRTTVATARAAIGQLIDLVALDDLLNFLESSRTQCGGKQCHRRRALGRIHFLQTDTATRNYRDREVGPVSPLLIIVEAVKATCFCFRSSVARKASAVFTIRAVAVSAGVDLNDEESKQSNMTSTSRVLLLTENVFILLPFFQTLLLSTCAARITQTAKWRSAQVCIDAESPSTGHEKTGENSDIHPDEFHMWVRKECGVMHEEKCSQQILHK